VSIGLLATVFPEEAVQAAVDEAGAREERTRSLPSKLMMYLAMALWLEPGKGYVRTLRGLLEGLRWSPGGWDGYRVPSDGAISLARYRLVLQPHLENVASAFVVGAAGSGLAASSEA
jgi:transposase IS4-like protein